MKQEIRIKFEDFWHPMTMDVILQEPLFRLLSKRFKFKIVDNPDFLIYSSFGKEFLKYNCVRIFYVGENIRPNFNECDYAFSFDYPVTERNYRLPLYKMCFIDGIEYLTEDYVLKLANRSINIDEIISKKRKFCNFIYSNAKAQERIDFFWKLQQYKAVDSGGKVLNNLGYIVDNKLAFLNNYKFTIAFENSSYPGYTTEKILHAFLANTIPIYWGNPLIDQDFNPKSFINCHEYSSFEKVIERVIEVDRNDDLLREYLEQPVFSSPQGNEYINEDNILERFNTIFSTANNIKLAAKYTDIYKYYVYQIGDKLKQEIATIKNNRVI
jgi:alpha(1,3/1,4) fucosyltransferase